MKWMKWPLFLVILLTVVLVLWKSGFVESVLGPWAAWAKFIGYFD
jgi:hypothetical protein